MTMPAVPTGISVDWRDIPGPQAYLAWIDQGGISQWVTFDVVESEKWEEGTEITEHPVEVGANVGDHVRVKLVTCELKVFVSQEPIDAAPYTGGHVQTFATSAPIPLSLPTPSWVPQGGVIIVPEWNSNIDVRTLGGQLVGLAGGFSGTLGDIAGLALIEAEDLALPGFQIDVPVPTDAGLLPPAPTPPAMPVVQQYVTSQDFVAAMHTALVFLKDSAQLLTVVGTKKLLQSMVIESLSFTRDVETGTGEAVTIGLKQVRIVQTQQVAAPIPNLSAGGAKPPANHGGQTPTPVPTSAAKAITAKPQIQAYAAAHPPTP